MRKSSYDNDILKDIRYLRSRQFTRSKFECLSLSGGQSEHYETYVDDYLKLLRGGLLENGEAFNGKELINDKFSKSAEKVEHKDLRILQSPSDERDEIVKGGEDSDEDDPLYKVFLSHVKVNGESLTFEIKEVNGLSKVIEYYKEEPIYDRQYRTRDRNMSNTSERKTKRKRTWSEPQSSKDMKMSHLRPLLIEKNNTPVHKHTSWNQTLSQLHPKSDKEGLGKLGVEQFDKSHSVGRGREQDSLVDADYKRFLNSSRLVNGRMKSRLGSNKTLVNNGGVWLDNVSCREVTNLRTGYLEVNDVEDDICCHMREGCETAALKEKVMAILRKPFDDQEYKKLWRDVNKRNYISRHKELHDGNEKSVTTRHKGKSYLKRYKAVRQKLEAVRGDKCKRLNILRGFVFYLEVVFLACLLDILQIPSLHFSLLHLLSNIVAS